MPTKRARAKSTARDEQEPKFLRGVVNPGSGINPRRLISRPRQADPISGNPVVSAVTLTQNPRGGF